MAELTDFIHIHNDKLNSNSCDILINLFEEYSNETNEVNLTDIKDISEEIQKEHVYKSIEILKKMIGKRPLGWYTGRDSVNTRKRILLLNIYIIGDTIRINMKIVITHINI